MAACKSLTKRVHQGAEAVRRESGLKEQLIRTGIVDAMEASGSSVLRWLAYRVRVRAVADVLRETCRMGHADCLGPRVARKCGGCRTDARIGRR